MIIRYLLTFSLLIGSVCSFAQDARKLVREVNRKFQSVRDYQADVRIRTDIPFVKMMPVNATVFFKQPDKFRIRSKGIALLPRQGFDQLFKNLLDTASYMPLLQGNENYRGTAVSVVNILPVSDTADLILGKLWIDPLRNLILRSQVTSRTNGTVDAAYYFGKQAAYALPDSMVFSIDTRKFKVPKAVAADLNNVKSSTPKDTKEKQKGMIYLQFTNYIINKGIPASVFSEKD